MKEIFTKEINETKSEVEDYINAKIDLIKLHTAENLSRFVSGMITKLVLLLIIALAGLFLSMAGAIWLDNYYNNTGLGFLIMSGVYILICLIFIALRKTFVIKPIIKSFVHLFFPIHPNYHDFEK